MKSAIQILTNAHRTCAIHLGVASVEDHNFRMFEYSQNILNNYDDNNYTSYNPSSHPKIKGIAYFDKHTQPSNDACVGQLLTNVIIFIFRQTIIGNGQWKVFGESSAAAIKQEILNLLYSIYKINSSLFPIVEISRRKPKKHLTEAQFLSI